MWMSIAGFIGVLVGAGITQFGAWRAHVRQVKHERERWLRDQWAQAHADALRSLLRSANRRSAVFADQPPMLLQKDQAAWFDDLTDAQHALQMLVRRCSPGHREAVTEAIGEVAELLHQVYYGEPTADTTLPTSQLGRVIDLIADAAPLTD